MERRQLSPSEREQLKMEKELERMRTEPEPAFIEPEKAEAAVKELMKKLGTPVEEGVSMLLESRIAAYYKQVHMLETAKTQPKAVDLLSNLYSACKFLIPELSQAGMFPVLVITTDGPQGALVPAKWKMEVKKQDLTEIIMMGEGLRDLSATFFHETRHAEQIWMEIQLRTQSGQGLPRIMKDTGLPKLVIENLQAVPLPTKADTAHIVKLMKLSTEEREKNREIIRRFLGVAGKMEGLALAAALGDKDAQKQLDLLKKEGKQVEQLYQAIPDEADAFAAQAVYEKYYDQHKGK